MSPHTHRKENRILVVEDEQAYRTPVISILRKAGFHCTFCVDGDHALRKLSQEKFDFLIVDFLVPGPNGVEIIKWAREHEINIPALIITNYLSDELTNDIKSLGRTRVMAKQSYNMEDLQNIVNEMLAS
jgi:DNA-binding response OmpR family regulator